MPLRSKVAKTASRAAAPPLPPPQPTAAARTARNRVEAGAKAASTPTATRPSHPTMGPQKASASLIKARQVVFGAGIFAIAIFGSIYGAGLKIRKDVTTKKEEWKNTTPEVQIMQLQAVRKKYEGMASELKAKLDVVEGRIKDRDTDGHRDESAET